MDSERYQQLCEEFKRKRAAALRAADARRAEACRQCPELSALMDERRQLLFDSGLAKLGMAAGAEERLARNQREIDRALTWIGWTREALEPQFSCRACGDTGFIPPRKTPCSCFERRDLELRGESLRLSEMKGFDAFDETLFSGEAGETRVSPREAMRKIRSYCEKYAQAFPGTEKQNLVFLGNTGLGKTFLAGCVAKRVLERGFSALLVTAYNFFSGILSSIRAQGVADLAPYLSAELLVLDDLGSEPMINNITAEYLFLLLNERAGKHTLIASNLMPGNFRERYGERVYSRVFDAERAQWFNFVGADLRTKRR